MNNEPLEKPYSDLRLAAMAPNTFLGTILKLCGPLLDKLLGINKLRNVYESCELSGLDKQAFSHKLLSGLGVQVSVLMMFWPKYLNMAAVLLFVIIPME